ncbi:MAG: hypothetical protein IJM04_07145 [Prevotella sp.]|nr:hypothetical protein [Prevotella sp.]
MRPPLDKFTEAMMKAGGNVTLVAKAFGVYRHTVYNWMNDNPDYKAALDDARGAFLDEALASARILVRGIPDVVKDPDGKTRQVGWITPPDSGMTRYIIGTLGRKEGLGEQIEIDAKMNVAPKSMTPEEAREYISRIEKEV